MVFFWFMLLSRGHDVPTLTDNFSIEEAIRHTLKNLDPMSSRKEIKNVFEAILEYGHDEDFVPHEGDQFSATDAPAGSDAKIEALRQRVLSGQPLWHDADRKDYSGLTGAIRPRE